MAILDRWRPFLITPKTLAFPCLELLSRDFLPPIVKGSGELRMPSLGQFEFTLTGVPENIDYAFMGILCQQRNPYDALARFRLRGTDEEGRHWSLGWTTPIVDPGTKTWTFVGETDGLHPPIETGASDSRSETELLFRIPRNHPVAFEMRRLMKPAKRAGQGDVYYRRTLEVLGSIVRFEYDPLCGVLSVTALHSTELPPTYTENWLGEPLRILFGQLLFPRIVARNLGNGSTIISIRRCPGFLGGAARLAALWQDEDLTRSIEEFWCQYVQLLVVIARAKNFEAHTITQLYEEIIQVARGTRWVWAMAFASSIEGRANILEPPGRARPDSDADAIDSMINYIRAWHGDARLKEIAINAVRRTSKTTTVVGLRRLVKAGAITRTHLSVWEDIRHAVMHGSLLSPYSGEEEDRKLHTLAEMMHALTLEAAARGGATLS
jgi:hypothetical protein